MLEAKTGLQLELSCIDSALDKSAEAYFNKFGLCDRPTAHPKNPSESDCLYLWTSIFRILMEKIQIKTGETMLEASKVMKKLQQMEHGEVTDAGKRVNCIFVAGGIEISNIEFKRPNVSGAEVAIQNRKNVRLARCIQEGLASFGVNEPVVYMADVHVQGFTGIFYRVRPMGDIAVAGTTTEEVVNLPSTVGGLREFLEDSSLPIIWSYIAKLEAHVPALKIIKEQNEARQARRGMAKHIFRSSTPPLSLTYERQIQRTKEHITNTFEVLKGHYDL
ncbi:hypothetical protein BX616_005373 [Lobosporangium transversale]|uniref:Uncharacterized protein n=1 Tax=Lobosporangium transversale TaxID=64571 RepID=A0A1Y2H1D2_9FUNG|nr:hypothetical protein BCR41DRAFT_392261 [Lobosporangium transversale]KAF9897550.1 hypothetical protein BX616_005373 [Lobosporangium transversale]ORZ27811.1 hypothetical protein BCR41DRAFT_392261 [Lobosporangium transversale]|eukprot:XP_021885514.1 hypothetical protein BCR41DRAFT_392261 [Lobosporangium transversale]